MPALADTLNRRITQQAPPLNDEEATQEIQALEEQKLENEKRELSRKELLRDTFAKCVRAFVYFAFALLCVTLSIVAFHYLGPEHWKWVTRDDLDTVTTVVFSGGIYAFIFLYIRDRI